MTSNDWEVLRQWAEDEPGEIASAFQAVREVNAELVAVLEAARPKIEAGAAAQKMLGSKLNTLSVLLEQVDAALEKAKKLS